MVAGIILLIILFLVLPVVGIISFFKTQGLLKETLYEIKSDMAVLNRKVTELTGVFRQFAGSTQQVETPVSTSQPFTAHRQPCPEKEQNTEALPPVTTPPFVAIEQSVRLESPLMVDTPSLPIEAVTRRASDEAHHEKPPVEELHRAVSLQPISEPPLLKPRAVQELENALARIWSWIIVGEENRRPGISMEFAVASTWLLRFGIIALVVCIAYFLRWSIDRGILGPEGRVSISVIAGLGMLTVGILNLNKKYHLLAQGFLGGGIAFLYFSTYAAGPMYSLVSTPVAFGLMILVTAVAGVLAVKIRSQLIAILGIIGGYATPIMLQSEQANFVVLYSYLLLLGMGILSISHVRQWRVLNYLGFIFNWAIFFGSLQAYESNTNFGITISFLSAIFILHSAIVYYYNLVRRKTSTLLEVLHLLLNGLLFALTSYNLIITAHGRPWPAVMAIALALFYVVHVFVFLKGRMHDRFMLVALIGLAGFFTAWSIPLITEKETLTICWSLLALFFLWTGLKLRSTMLISMSTLLYLIVIVRMAALDMPRSFGTLDWSTRPPLEYWGSLWTRLWNLGTVIASLFSAAWLHRRNPGVISALAVETQNQIPFSVPHPVLLNGTFWVGVVLLFATMHFELFMMLSYAVAVRVAVTTGLWVAFGVYLLYHFDKSKEFPVFACAGAILLISLYKLFIFDFISWNFGIEPFVYRSSLLEFSMRLLDYGLVFLLMLLALRTASRTIVSFSPAFKSFPVVLFFIYATLETNTFFHWHQPLFRPGALSVLWAFFAISFLAIGIRNISKSWRFSGLALFCVVVGKVFLFDLADMETIYRVVAFMMVGVLLLGGSFAYIKAERKFIEKGQE